MSLAFEVNARLKSRREKMNQETILKALRALAARLERSDVVGEINLLGGTAMVLGFRARQSTKDVHAVFAPPAIVREETRYVASELGLPEDWLNDAAKGFVSPRAEYRELADVDPPYLRVQVPQAEYLLAMKVMAARAVLADGTGDKEDIRFLIRLLDLKTAGEVMEIVMRYYDPERILPRSHYLVEEIIVEESRQ
jgi:hypothetical protein